MVTEDEAIDISLTAQPKETPRLTDLTGIRIRGKLATPELNINPVAVAARGVVAATLAILLLISHEYTGHSGGIAHRRRREVGLDAAR